MRTLKSQPILRLSNSYFINIFKPVSLTLLSVRSVKNMCITSLVFMVGLGLTFDMTLPLGFAFVILTICYNTILRAFILQICLTFAIYYLITLGFIIYDINSICKAIVLMMNTNSGSGGGNGNSGPCNNMPGGPQNNGGEILLGKAAGSQELDETDINTHAQHYVNAIKQNKTEDQIVARLAQISQIMRKQIGPSSSRENLNTEGLKEYIKEFIQISQASHFKTRKDEVLLNRIDKAKN